MEHNSATFFELIIMMAYLGSVTYIVGLLLQVVITLYFDKKIAWGKLILSLILTRIVSWSITLIIWRYWFLSIDIMQVPFFIPAVFAEILVLTALILGFNYKLMHKSNE